MIAQDPIVLETAAQELADATSKPPFLYQLEPAAARKILDDLLGQQSEGGRHVVADRLAGDRPAPLRSGLWTSARRNSHVSDKPLHRSPSDRRARARCVC